MARIPHNKGSYNVLKSGRVQIKYPLGFNERSGKYENYSEHFGSEAEAISALKEINDYIYHGGTPEGIASHRRGAALKDAALSETFHDFAGAFVADREKRGAVAERTIQDYRVHLKRIDPYLGNLLISTIGPRDIDELYTGLRSSDRRNNGSKPVSGTYLEHIHSTLSLVFDRAVTYGITDKNPCKSVDKPKRDTKEKTALSVEQCRAFIGAVYDRGLEAKNIGLLICLCTAARLSEMLALTWGDYENGSLHITKAMKKDSQESKKTKTEDIRNDPCPPILIDSLAEWRDIQAKLLEKMGLKQDSNTPIVSNKKGTHTLKSTFERWFRLQKTKYGLPEEFTIHGLRHTAATILQKDCQVDMATTMGITGHKTMEMLKRYSHTDDTAKRAAIAAFGNLLSPEKGEACCRNCRYWAVSPVDAGDA